MDGMLVALDTNVVDLIEKACSSSDHVEAMEAMLPPPRFTDMPLQQEAEVFACYWLLALAPAWRSTVYTFSEALYEEVARAPNAGSLLRIAFDVLVREEQEPQYRYPDAGRRPPLEVVRALGLSVADATPIADAIGLNCDQFLTNDRQLWNRSSVLKKRWHLRVRRPSEFLIEAVQSGAQWASLAPWPWESIERIRGSLARPAQGKTPVEPRLARSESDRPFGSMHN